MIFFSCGNKRPTLKDVEAFAGLTSLQQAANHAKQICSHLTPLSYFHGHVAKQAKSYSLPRHSASEYFALLAISTTGNGTNMDIGRFTLQGRKAQPTTRRELPAPGCAEPLRYADSHNLFSADEGEGGAGAPVGGNALQLLFGSPPGKAAPSKAGGAMQHKAATPHAAAAEPGPVAAAAGGAAAAGVAESKAS